MTDAHEPEKNTDPTQPQPEAEPSIADAPTPNAEAQFVAETDAHTASTRRGWKIAAAVAVVVLVAAAGAYALWGGRSAQPAASSSPAPEVTTVPAVVGTATPSAPRGSVTGTIAPGGASAEGSSPASAQGRPRGSSGGPAAKGAPLGELSQPPEKTAAMLVVPKGFTLAAYNVVFEPYGWGPGGKGRGKLLVRIVSSKAANASATSLKTDFAGRNVSVWCAPRVITTVSVGGSYQGVLQVRPQGDVGVLYMAQATPVK